MGLVVVDVEGVRQVSVMYVCGLVCMCGCGMCSGVWVRVCSVCGVWGQDVCMCGACMCECPVWVWGWWCVCACVCVQCLCERGVYAQGVWSRLLSQPTHPSPTSLETQLSLYRPVGVEVLNSTRRGPDASRCPGKPPGFSSSPWSPAGETALFPGASRLF